jgi:hypothetical protein
MPNFDTISRSIDGCQRLARMEPAIVSAHLQFTIPDNDIEHVEKIGWLVFDTSHRTSCHSALNRFSSLFSNFFLFYPLQVIVD